jgi:uncharacterized ion transporter superfamily protein YfcC
VIKVPHTLNLLLGIMLLAYITTWALPQGFFETVTLDNGREAVVANTYSLSQSQVHLSPMDLFSAIPRAFAKAQDIIFFVFIIGGVLSIVKATGTIDGIISGLLKRYSHKPQRLLFAVIFSLALLSSLIGSGEEYTSIVLILLALCRALKFDAITAVSMVIFPFGIGFAVSAFNPFTVLIAQDLAGLPLYSGFELRLALFIPFVLIGADHIWRYSKRVKADSNYSLMNGVANTYDNVQIVREVSLQTSHKVIALGLVVVLGTSIWGISQKGWICMS